MNNKKPLVVDEFDVVVGRWDSEAEPLPRREEAAKPAKEPDFVLPLPPKEPTTAGGEKPSLPRRPLSELMAGAVFDLAALSDEAETAEDQAENARAVDEMMGEEEPDLIEPKYMGQVVPYTNGAKEMDVIGEISLRPVEQVPRDVIEAMNRKHAVIGNYGGKTMVLSWERSDVYLTSYVPTFQNFADIRNLYNNKIVMEGRDPVPIGNFWLNSPQRLSYAGVAFAPNEPMVLDGERLNLWGGFAIAAKSGDWSRMRQHIYEVIGNGDPKAGEYAERWLAWTLQNPGKPAEVVLVLRGGQGSGKGTLTKAMIRIFGPHAKLISDREHLTGKFSGHLQRTCLLVLDEAFWAGDHKGEGRLKSLITEERILVEPKHVDPFEIPNLLHIMMTSNNDWVVPAAHDARRYNPLDVGNHRIGDGEYFRLLNEEMENGGLAAMLYDMLAMDLGNWHPKQIYKTQALEDQKRLSLRGLDVWLVSMLEDGMLPVPFSNKWPNRCLSDHLLTAAKQHDRYANELTVTDKLKKVFGDGRQTEGGMKPFNNKIARGWAFPPLTECRVIWERRFGGWTWDNPVPEWRYCQKISFGNVIDGTKGGGMV